MFGAVIAHQRLDDRLFAGFDAVIAQLCQHLRIALSRQNRVDDGQTGNPAMSLIT